MKTDTLSKSVGILVLDQEGRIWDINSAALDLLKIKKNKLLNSLITDVWPSLFDFNTAVSNKRKRSFFVKKLIKEINSPAIKSIELSASESGSGVFYLFLLPADSSKISAALSQPSAPLSNHCKEVCALFANTSSGFICAQIKHNSSSQPIDFEILEANHAIKRILGAKGKNKLKENLISRLGVSSAKEYLDKYHKDNAQSEKKWEQYFASSERWYLITLLNLQSNHFAIIWEDITQYKKTEEELKENRERYQQLTSLISDFVYSFDVSKGGKLVNNWVAGAFKNITGFAVAELKRQGGWEKLIYPPDLPIAYQQLKKLLRGEPSTVEYRIVTKQKKVRWMRDYGRPVLDKDSGKIKSIVGAVQDITIYKNSLERLKLSEKKFRELFDGAPVPMLICDISSFLQWKKSQGLKLAELSSFLDQDSNISSAISLISVENINREAGEMLGVGQNNGSRLNFAQLFQVRPKDWREFLAMLLSGKQEAEIEIDLQISKEKERAVLLKYMVLSALKKETILVSIIDISRVKKAQKELAASEERLRAIFMAAYDAIFVKDKNLRYTHINRGAEKLFGLKAKEVIGKTDVELKRKIKLTLNPKVDERILAGENFIKEELVKARKEGVEYYQVIKVPLKNKRGDIEGICGVARDVTELRRTENKLKEVNRLNFEIVENAPFGVFVLDETGKVIYINAAMQRISGADSEHFADLNLLKHPRYIKLGLANKIKQALQGKEFKIDGLYYVSDAGKETVRNYVGIPFHHQNRRQVLLFVEDITQQKLVEKKLRERNEELERFNKIAIDRELKMIELKEKIRNLENQAN